jgi:hypothetical protein
MVGGMKPAPWFAILALAPSIPVGAATSPASPPLAVESNEANADQLAVALAEGAAVRRGWELEQPEVPGASAELAAGEYRLLLTLTRPEGWYEPAGDQLAWHEPPGAGAHLRVVIVDGADGRTVPGLQVRAAIDDGAELPLSFGWYPLLNGYGANVAADPGAAHAVRVRILPAAFRRHDPYNGERFDQETVANFGALTAPRTARAAALSEVEERLAGQAGLQGGAMGRAVRAMNQQATSGAGQLSTDYRIEAAVEYAEAYWFCDPTTLAYKSEVEASSAENCHIEIAPRDAWTGRFLPELNVTVTVWNANGHEIGTRPEPLMWHPWLYHYGENWRVPLSGRYRIRATFPAPAWRRYGATMGRRFAQGATVEYRELRIKSGEK